MNLVMQTVSDVTRLLSLTLESAGIHYKKKDHVIFSNAIQNVVTVANLGIMAVAKYKLASLPLLTGSLLGVAVALSSLMPILEEDLSPNTTVKAFALGALQLTKVALKIGNIFLAYTVYKNTHSIVLPVMIAGLSVINLGVYSYRTLRK